MRIAIVFVGLLFWCLPSSAQYLLTVAVVDRATGAPVTGATVDLMVSGTVVQTDLTGSDGISTFTVGTSVQEVPDLNFGIGAPWPNPSSGTSTVSLQVRSPGLVGISVVDLLGRTRAALTADLPTGGHRARLSLAGLNAGVYFVRVESSASSASRPFTLVASKDGVPSVVLEEGVGMTEIASKTATMAGGYVVRVSSGGFPTKTAFVRVEGDASLTVVLDAGGRPGSVNSVGMELIRIPAGTFTMGSSNGYVEERPSHTVTITRDFWMGKYEVTQSEYHVVTERPISGSDREPVEGEPWTRAVEFANALSRRENLPECYDSSFHPVVDLQACTGYRLPTEAEWEYATRAQTTTDYSFGNDASALGQYAWYFGNSNNGDRRKPQEVGRLLPNPWGLHDVHGNVWEWVHDRYGAYDSSAPVTDPLGAPEGSYRVIRGGAWDDHAFGLRSARRYYLHGRLRGFGTGFRIARTAR